MKFALVAAVALPAAGVTELPAMAGGQPALDDGAIIAIYNQVNSFDIETALLGQVMGHSPDVRALGKMVSSDHTGVRKAAHELAGKIGVELTLPAARMEAAKRAALIAPARPIASVPTGMPAGIWTMERSESSPLSALVSTGTPITGNGV